MNITEMRQQVARALNTTDVTGEYVSQLTKLRTAIEFLTRLSQRSLVHPEAASALAFLESLPVEDHSREVLIGADFSERILVGSSFHRANLTGANLYKADLADCDLSRADFTGATLECANLRGANLTGATFLNTKISTINGADHFMDSVPTIIEDEFLDDWGLLVADTCLTGAYCIAWTHQDVLAGTVQTFIDKADWAPARVQSVFDMYYETIEGVINSL